MNLVAVLRTAGICEGLSWLVLLFVAMPLKYVWGYPMAVRVVGTIHGGLFVVFVLLLAVVHLTRSWPIARSALVFLAALLPFGFLFIDRRLREATPESSA